MPSGSLGLFTPVPTFLYVWLWFFLIVFLSLLWFILISTCRIYSAVSYELRHGKLRLIRHFIENIISFVYWEACLAAQVPSLLAFVLDSKDCRLWDFQMSKMPLLVMVSFLLSWQGVLPAWRYGSLWPMFYSELGGDTAHGQSISWSRMVLSGCPDILRWTDKVLPKTTALWLDQALCEQCYFLRWSLHEKLRAFIHH